MRSLPRLSLVALIGVALQACHKSSDGGFVIDIFLPSTGALDASFDGDGKAQTIITPSTDDYGQGVALQTDGKIVVAGYTWTGVKFDFAVVRYNADGSLDASFDGDGIVTTPVGGSASAYAVAIQPDGRIVVVGYATVAGNNDFAVVRYNTDGSLDTAFDTDGKVTTPIGGSTDQATSVALQADGRIVVAGSAYNGTNFDFAVVRYNADGSLDTGFDTDGKATLDIGGADFANSVALQGSKIVVAGYANPGATTDFAVVRYNSDGSLDTTFDGDGIVTTPVGTGGDYGYSVAIDSSNRIVVGGYISEAFEQFALVRYNTDGSLDTSFGTGGKVTTTFGFNGAVCYAIALQPDGKIVAAGSYTTGPAYVMLVARYNSDGTLDTTFDTDGYAISVLTTGTAGNGDGATAVAIQPDGGIVAAGYGNNGTDSDFYVVRYHLTATTFTPSTGALDTTFDGDGKATTAFGSTGEVAHGVAVQPNGKIVVAGSTFNGADIDFAVARFNADGSLDTTFSTDGKVTTGVVASSNDTANGIALQPDGKIVAAGDVFSAGDGDFGVVRYNVDGSLDTTFNGTGKATASLGSVSESAKALAIQPNGKILVVGVSNQDFAVVRFNADGSLDTTFSADGKVTTPVGGAYDEARSVAPQTDGKIVVAGISQAATMDFAVVRYNVDGSLDTSFNTTGIAVTPVGAASDLAYAVAIQSDGKIVVAGYADIAGTDDFALVRYNTNGTLDTTFDTDGKVTTTFGFSGAQCYGAALQPDGKIVAVGAYYANPAYVLIVARYNSDGSLDTTFDTDGFATTVIGTSTWNGANAVAIQPDGGIVAAGYGQPASNTNFLVVRYH